jgi:hypothetical protein
MRPAACISVPGSSDGSMRYTVDAAVSVMPTAPVRIVMTKTLVAAFPLPPLLRARGRDSAVAAVAAAADDDDEDDEDDADDAAAAAAGRRLDWKSRIIS